MIAGGHQFRRPAGWGRNARLALVSAALLSSCAVGPSSIAPASAPDALVAPTQIPSDPGPGDSGVRLPDGGSIPNLTAIKRQIVAYHDHGVWREQIDDILDEARERLDRELSSRPSRPAIVLDVDDTALSTFAAQRHLGFGWVPELWDQWVESGAAEANPGVLDLYRYALERGVAIFFVTGRREHLRTATERQLRSAGFDSWTALYFRPDLDRRRSVVPFKVDVRRAIEEDGFAILLNVGDQWSDLEGGFARTTYKLPNPVYYRP